MVVSQEMPCPPVPNTIYLLLVPIAPIPGLHSAALVADKKLVRKRDE